MPWSRFPTCPSSLRGLALAVGLIAADSSGERLLAAPTEFWTDNAVHLPQMISTAWIGLKSWQEVEAPGPAGITADPALPYLRLALLLWLSALDDSEWAVVDELKADLAQRYPLWERLYLVAEAEPAPAGSPKRPNTIGGRARSGASPREVQKPSALDAVLLGAAYPLGLVRAAEESGTGRRVVQLTPLGRYVLALGPTPPPRQSFEQFLFVQPNFEMIAYRQGLTPQLTARLSRFAWWSQIGSALELKLTRESIVHGLDGGLTSEAILEILARHSQRALPPGITDAISNWATRRERVTYYSSCTLMEFGSAADRDAALALWSGNQAAPPIVVAERFLLVEDEKTVPFDRFRLVSSRDYRRPPEICALIEPDGVTMVLDPARSDLLVEAELARFADLVPGGPSNSQKGSPAERREFKVTPASLRRGVSRGMAVSQLVDWYQRRTGGDLPPAVRLLLAARSSRVPSLKAARMLVLNLPSEELLDGLVQHPATSPLLGQRLGPAAVVIAEDRLAALQKTLKELGIDLQA